MAALFKNNRNLFIIAVIAVVNALGYAIIIPILYSYSLKFGLNDFQNGLLFAVFSLFQFLSTPVIGRMSDKFGRRPLLLISLAGTAISFFMMAFAPSAIFLFLARALDGITAGNIPVASAVISDTTAPQDRAKGFGIIGASFGFGFIFGPAISAFTLHWGSSVPFIIAGVITLIAIALTAFILPETNVHMGQVVHGKLFDFPKLAKSLTDENVGLTLLVSLIYSFAFGLFIFAYQPVSKKIIGLSDSQIAIMFTLFGIVGLIAQTLIIPRFTKAVGDRKALTISLIGLTVTFFSFFLVRSFMIMAIISIAQALANSFVAPLVQALLSKEVDAKSQGSILGINASYVSLGMIFGPIICGAVATILVPLPFLVGSASIAACVLLSVKILRKPHVQHTF